MRSHQTILAASVFFISIGNCASAQSTPAPINVTPSSASLKAGETMMFQALASNQKMPGPVAPEVIWSLVPPIGSIAKGLYTAPAVIDQPQVITVIATDILSAGNTGSATIWLESAVGISIAPSSASLQPGRSVRFNATVTGASKTDVSWSLNPAVGTIDNGTYTAPATMAAAQTILLTATSVADPGKTAQAYITLTPSAPMTVSPAQITLQPSQVQQFTAMLGSAATSGVQWSISPSIGSITAGGQYTAPSAISQAQTVTVLATAPSQTASATINLAAPAPTSTSAGYNAISDTIPRAEGPAPALGPANSVYIDPDFGTRLLRVTDQNSIAGKTAIDLFGAAGWQSEFSADSSKLVISSADGFFYFYKFDPVAFQASLIMDPADSTQPFTLSNLWVGGFSYQNPNVVYGMTTGLTNHTIMQYDLSTNQTTAIANIDSFLPSQDQDWSGSSPLYRSVYNDYFDNNFVAPASHYIVVYSKVNNQAAVINVADSTFKAFNSSAYVPLGGGTLPSPSGSMHGVEIDKSGRYVAISFNDSNANVYVDLQSGTWTNDLYFHRVTGFGSVVVDSGNQNSNDSDGYYLANLSNPAQRQWLGSNPNPPNRWNSDGHPSWNNARPGALLPFIVDNQVVYTSIFPPRSWDDELLGVATDGSNKVWRFAHMHSYRTGFYWTTPFSHVSPDGKYALFTSNWGGTLGTASDNQGSFNGSPLDQKRVDVFLVELNQLYPASPVDSIPPAKPLLLDTTIDGSENIFGTINLTAVAIDNVGVVAMRYAVDGTWGPEITTAPFAFFLDTTTITNGYHWVEVYARDAQNNISTNIVNFVVRNSVAPKSTAAVAPIRIRSR